MTKKDYIAIAEAFSIQHHVPTADAVVQSSNLRDVAERLTRYLAADNPRFDRDKFLRACGF